MSTTTELKPLPCPFCGCKNIGIANERHDHSGGYYIGCPECDASTGLRYACGEDPTPILVEAWNRRSAAHGESKAGEWNAAIQAAYRAADSVLPYKDEKQRNPVIVRNEILNAINALLSSAPAQATIKDSLQVQPAQAGSAESELPQQGIPFKLVNIVTAGYEGYANLIYTGPEAEGVPVAMLQPLFADALREVFSRAALSAQGQQTPEGCVIVPEYPTQTMRDAGNKALDMLKTEPGMGIADRAYYAYMAMIAAAPINAMSTPSEKE